MSDGLCRASRHAIACGATLGHYEAVKELVSSCHVKRVRCSVSPTRPRMTRALTKESASASAIRDRNAAS